MFASAFPYFEADAELGVLFWETVPYISVPKASEFQNGPRVVKMVLSTHYMYMDFVRTQFRIFKDCKLVAVTTDQVRGMDN